MMRIHGILVTYRRPADLRRTLGTLADQDRRPDSLLVIDNGGEATTADAVAAYRARGGDADLMMPGDNLGPAGAIALGIERIIATAAADDAVVIFDDDDTPADPDSLARMASFAAAVFAADPSAGAVGLIGARLDRRTGRLTRIPDPALHGRVPVDYLGGGAIPHYRVAALRAMAAPRADLFFGFDDLDLGLRLRRAGYALFADGDAWRRERERRGRLGLVVTPALRTDAPTWRRYYSVRNMIALLRDEGAHRAAVLTSVTALGKPVVNIARARPGAAATLRLNARAVRDAWNGRMGRTVEPDAGVAAMTVEGSHP